VRPSMLLTPSARRDDLAVAPVSRPSTPSSTPSTTPSTPASSTTSVPSRATPSTPAERAEFDALLAAVVPCRTEDPELWFAERTADVERAKALCRGCPLAAGCLAGAVERNEPWGVWGGEVFVDGKIVALKRGRGRPRKARPEDAQVA